jgi:hypothetical protein
MKCERTKVLSKYLEGPRNQSVVSKDMASQWSACDESMAGVRRGYLLHLSKVITTTSKHSPKSVN